MTEAADLGVIEEAQPVAVGSETLDPITDVEAKTSKNYARVGSIRPSAMMYTNGIGATVDLPHFAVMPSGIDAWERVYARRAGGADMIAEPRLLELTRAHLGSQVVELRKPPWAPEEKGWSAGSAIDLGIPSRIFPQWLRCTGCGRLAPVSHELFAYRNVVKYRPDRAEFIHEKCKGFEGKKKPFKAVALPARYLIACVSGHLDEFPYDAWVHRGAACSSGSPFPTLRMREWKSNIGPDVQIHCLSCQQSRGMLEAVGPKAKEKLPMCRGRHPHLDAFYKCGQRGRLMMLGAANQWFASTLGLLALPREEVASAADLVPLLRTLPKGELDEPQSVTDMKMWRKFAAMAAKTDAFDDVPDETLWEAVQVARDPAAKAVRENREPPSDPLAILAPEWAILSDEAKYTRLGGSRDFRALRRDVPPPLKPVLTAVAAVERLKKVNAFLGFTRIDALDRIDDAATRIAPLCVNGKPTWVPATEDRGEGIFLQFDESSVAAWEEQVVDLPVWTAFQEAHKINFRRRTSKTADDIDPDSRFPPPRYWAIHSLSHLLIREAAMSSGYGSASLTERIYAWQARDEYAPAAGLLICTTASDGEGTLGGLVELARPAKLEKLFRDAVRRGWRCSSDPICSHRAPKGKEEFLHGAACHFCLFLSETSCERTNRFLDRRLLLGLTTDPDVRTPGLLEGLSLLSVSTAEIERLGELLSAEEAKSIAAALRQVKLPHVAAKRAYAAHRSEVQQLLKQLISGDSDAARVAAVLDGIAAVPQIHRPVVVWTSPSIPGSTGHTTLAALDMINDAITHVHAATYSAGKDSPHLSALRNALDRGVSVTVVVDVKERSDAAALIAQRLNGARIWTLAEPANGQWAIQHSKLIAVDDSCAFVTSANFSTAAAMRSLECGMLSQDGLIAKGIREHLENLHAHGILIDFNT